MQELFVLLFIAGFVYLWFSGLKARELALKSARESCEKQNVQLLDQTVEISKRSFGRSRSGQLCIVRHFSFEYCTDGENRYAGSLSVKAERCSAVWMQSNDQAPCAAPTQSGAVNEGRAFGSCCGGGCGTTSKPQEVKRTEREVSAHDGEEDNVVQFPPKSPRSPLH